MATVWRAYDELLERTVAVKIMSDALAASPVAVARFAREARTHANIVHPNLVQVYDYSVTAAQPYLVLEYVPGDTLSRRLDRGSLEPTTLRRLATDLLAALACIHDHGVLHRDIKPANVLLGREGNARLTDFGIAQLESSTRLTAPGDVVGTLRFLAPELLDGDPPSRQSDLFAFGVLLRTANGPNRADPGMTRLIEWLTRPGPGLRPADAHAALAALREEPPTARLDPPTAVMSGVRAARTAASAAGPRLHPLLRNPVSWVAVGTALVATLALLIAPGPEAARHGSVGHKRAATHAKVISYTRPDPPPTPFDARLDQLANSVRAATRR